MATFWVERDNFVNEPVLRAKDLVPGSIADALAKWMCLHWLTCNGKLVHDGGGFTCSLCPAYPHCDFCPIKMYTGIRGCLSTPYQQYYGAVTRGDLAAARSAAEGMVRLLELLLEEETGGP